MKATPATPSKVDLAVSRSLPNSARRSSGPSSYAVALVVLAVFILLTEKLLIPFFERCHLLEGALWRAHNRHLYQLNCERNYARQDNPLWRSNAFEQLLPANPKRFRIVVLGDSVAWGDGYLNLNDLWWRQLESDLRDRGYAVDVFCASFPGWSLADEADALPQLRQQLAPDLMVCEYKPDDACVDDSDYSDVIFQIPPQFYFPQIEQLFSTYFPNLYIRADVLRCAILQRLLAGPKYGLLQSDWELTLLSGAPLERFKEAVQSLGNYLETSGQQCVVIGLPTSGQAQYLHDRFTPVANIFREGGVAFADLSSAFLADSSGPLSQGSSRTDLTSQWVNPGNHHPSPRICTQWAHLAAQEIVKRFGKQIPRMIMRTQATINDWLPCVRANRKGPADVELHYPNADCLPIMPLGEPFFQMNLERPVPINTLRVTSNSLERIEAFACYSDASGEESACYSLGACHGKCVEWHGLSSNERPVRSFRFVATFATSDRRIRITALTGAETGAKLVSQTSSVGLVSH
jgi:hypothetical protein